jgi:hypothetical protein
LPQVPETQPNPPSANFSRSTTSSWLRTYTSIFLLVNAALLSAYSFSGNAAFSSINNFLAAVFSLYCVILAAIKGRVFRRHNIFVFSLLIVGAATLVFHAGTLNAADVVKFYSLFVFYGVGRYVLTAPFMSKWLAVALAVIVGLGLIGTTRIYDAATAFSYFPNANTATLYVSSVLFAMAPFLGFNVIILQVVQVLFFQKVGAILATFASLLVEYILGLNFRSFILIVAFTVSGFVALELGLLDRFLSVLYALVSDLSEFGFDGVSKMSYDEIISRQNSTDLSGYFRVKHWIEILNLYIGGGPITHALGYGPGMTPYLTSSRLVPHNDYLRVLAEFGCLNFVLFCVLNLHAYISLHDKALRAIFLVILVYFFSENLIDNYASMLMLYMASGFFSRRRAT